VTLGEADSEGALLPLLLPLLHLLEEGVTEGDTERLGSVEEEEDLEGEVEVEGLGVKVGDTLGLEERDWRGLGVTVPLPERLGVGEVEEVEQREGDLEEEGVPLGVTDMVAQEEEEIVTLGLDVGVVIPLLLPVPLSETDKDPDSVEVGQGEGEPLKVAEMEGQAEMDTLPVRLLTGVMETDRVPVIEGLLDTLGEGVPEAVTVGCIEGVDWDIVGKEVGLREAVEDTEKEDVVVNDLVPLEHTLGVEVMEGEGEAEAKVVVVMDTLPVLVGVLLTEVLGLRVDKGGEELGESVEVREVEMVAERVEVTLALLLLERAALGDSVPLPDLLLVLTPVVDTHWVGEMEAQVVSVGVRVVEEHLEGVKVTLGEDDSVGLFEGLVEREVLEAVVKGEVESVTFALRDTLGDLEGETEVEGVREVETDTLKVRVEEEHLEGVGEREGEALTEGERMDDKVGEGKSMEG